MTKDFPQIEWDERLDQECRQLVRMGIWEDLDAGCDWTTVAMVEESERATAWIVTRQGGVVAGLAAMHAILSESACDLHWQPYAEDGQAIAAHQPLGALSGSVRDLLTLERLILNLVGHLSGISTLTSIFVAHIHGSPAAIYDTRKTTPGWRRLEKYAVRCGGGHNHRMGLYAAVMIKDNHLELAGFHHRDPSQSLRRIRKFLQQSTDVPQDLLVEIELDSLDHLPAVLREKPDIVLLDNMLPTQLTRAVEMRNKLAPDVQLEASGGVDLTTVATIARTGVDRISVGALTHSARYLDVALDWREDSPAPITPR